MLHHLPNERKNRDIPLRHRSMQFLSVCCWRLGSEPSFPLFFCFCFLCISMNLFVTARSSFFIAAALSFCAGRKRARGLLRGVARQVDYGGSWDRWRLRVLRPTSFQTIFRRIFASMFLRIVKIVRHCEEPARSAMLRVACLCSCASPGLFQGEGCGYKIEWRFPEFFCLLFRGSSQSCRNDGG